MAGGDRPVRRRVGRPGRAISRDRVGVQVSGHKCVAIPGPDLDRERLRSTLAERGVLLGRGVYEVPSHRQPVFANLNTCDPFPVADEFADRHVCLPLWRAMPESAVSAVIESFSSAVG